MKPETIKERVKKMKKALLATVLVLALVLTSFSVLQIVIKAYYQESQA